jgi:hypothetical protein
MPQFQVSLGPAVWDTDARTIELTFIADYLPPYPPGWDPDQVDPLERLSVSLTAPARAGAVTIPSVVRRTLVDGSIVYTKWTWSQASSSWGNPTRVKPGGTPWTD